MAKTTIGVRLTKEAQQRLEALEAERQLVNARWETFSLTGETLDHGDVKAWAAGLVPSKPETP